MECGGRAQRRRRFCRNGKRQITPCENGPVCAHFACMKTPNSSHQNDYPEWITRRIGAEVHRRREALGLSAGALGRAAKVSDQTILNIERGVIPNGSWVGTLARISMRLGIRLSELIWAAERGE